MNTNSQEKYSAFVYEIKKVIVLLFKKNNIICREKYVLKNTVKIQAYSYFDKTITLYTHYNILCTRRV